MEIVKLLVAHSTFGDLLAIRSEQFIDRGSGDRPFQEI